MIQLDKHLKQVERRVLQSNFARINFAEIENVVQDHQQTLT